MRFYSHMRRRAGAMVAFAGLLAAGSVSASTFKDIYSFCGQAKCTDGNYPGSALVKDAAGNLYGTSALGGDAGWGTIFELIPNGKGGYKYKRLHSFCGKANCTDGSDPVAGPIIDAAGNLYGTTKFGGVNNGGTAYELVLSGAKPAFRVLHSFCAQGASCADGSLPVYDGLTYEGAATGTPYDGTSPLYGTTQYGGMNNSGLSGVVYELKPVVGKKRWKESVLYDFCAQSNCADGSEPFNGLVVSKAGDLFGVTFAGGGANDDGTIFELSMKNGQWTQSVLYDFCSGANCSDGNNPESPLAMDASGNLFGTTTSGGAHAGGVLFRLVPKRGNPRYSVLYNFCSQANCTDGSNPMGRLALDQSGHIFGTTLVGGDVSSNKGIAYELSGSSLSVLHAFCTGGNCVDGQWPVGGLILDTSGNLFGTTSEGGGASDGVVFEVTP